jgi:hypothetical protein
MGANMLGRAWMYDGGNAGQSSNLSSLVLMRLREGLFFAGPTMSRDDNATDDDIGITLDQATGIV